MIPVPNPFLLSDSLRALRASSFAAFASALTLAFSALRSARLRLRSSMYCFMRSLAPFEPIMAPK